MSQQEARKLVWLTQPQISRLMRGDTREFSYERLMRVLTALGQDVEITIRQTRNSKKKTRARAGPRPRRVIYLPAPALKGAPCRRQFGGMRTRA